jgi:hypothetical protein
VVNNTPDNIYPPSVPVSPPTVTNCNDSGTGSLRQAVAGATSGETISFALSPSCSVITLTGGVIEIGINLTIDGPGAGTLAVSGNNASQVFVVDSGVTATISGLTIENGSAGVLGCSTEAELATCFGGGIDNNGGTVYLSNSTVADNTANTIFGFGGGIMNTSGLATLYVTDSTISGNSAQLGGGIYNNGAELIVSDSTISGNSAENGGGGRHGDCHPRHLGGQQQPLLRRRDLQQRRVDHTRGHHRGRPDHRHRLRRHNHRRRIQPRR